MKGLVQHRYISRNQNGRDFFVGDVHGSWSEMLDLMYDRSFDFEHDRLFSTGDLIDRGMDSPGALSLLEAPWFYSVLGNHELMLVEGRKDERVREYHLGNGGEWSFELSCDQLDRLINLIRDHMPLAFTIDAGWGEVGVIHAEAPESWHCLTSRQLSDAQWKACSWGFYDYTKVKEERGRLVQGIDLVVSGHVGCERITRGPNQCWIDTYQRSGFYILTAEELIHGLIRVS